LCTQITWSGLCTRYNLESVVYSLQPGEVCVLIVTIYDIVEPFELFVQGRTGRSPRD